MPAGSPTARTRQSPSGRRGGEAVAIHLDLADGDSVERVRRRRRPTTLGEIEIVVSNAAMNMAGAVLDTDAASLEDVLAVNITGTHRLVRALLPDMVRPPPG